MKAVCPKCDAFIPASQVNVATDVAACPQCEEVFAISSILTLQDIPSDFDIHRPPQGAWFEEGIHGWRIGASTRSAAAFIMVPFMCVWSGFSLGGIYGTQIAKGEFNLLQSLFGIPFALGTLLFGSITLFFVFGRIEISVTGNEGRCFCGIGPLGFTQRFKWSEVIRVEECLVGEQPAKDVVMVGKTRLRLGATLSDRRHFFLLYGLRTLLQLAYKS